MIFDHGFGAVALKKLLETIIFELLFVLLSVNLA